MPADSYTDYVWRLDHIPTRNSTAAVRLINDRQGLFELESMLEDALDEYAFVRDAYLQHREHLNRDGAAVEETFDEELFMIEDCQEGDEFCD